MLKLEIGMSNKGGFTLVEILVVLLIIGITIGFALLSFGDFGAKRRVVFASEQFINFVKLVQQQAILETGTLGVFVNGGQYQALHFDASSNWKQYPANSIFRVHSFPAQVKVKFLSQTALGNNPQIVMNASGDMSPFKLAIYFKNHQVTTIIGHQNGAVSFEMSPSS